MKYKFYNNETLYTMNDKYTYDDLKKNYPWLEIEGIKCVTTDSFYNGNYLMEFSEFCKMYKQRGLEITDGMKDDEILLKAEEFDNKMNEEQVSIQERLVAALEFMNLSNLQDKAEV